VPFETIQPEVERLRNYIVGDLDYLLSKKTGGNYLAAALITCACDTLAYLKYGNKNSGHRFFQEVIPEKWSCLAKGLYQAIRDGIVHSYDTKTICVGSRTLTINISWSRKPHFHLSSDRAVLHINIRDLAAAFKMAVSRFETDLANTPLLRDTFAKRMDKARALLLYGKDATIWEECLCAMPTLK
jgi:hypothetical protein